MPGQTSRAALRFPIGTDSPDVPRDITNLANDADLLTARLLAATLQEGVVGNGSLQASVSTGQAVSIAAGLAVIADDATAWTLTPVYQAAATIVNFNASHGSLPRIDQVYKTLSGTLVYVPGTATTGATLDNRNGNNDAGAPANSIRLCDVLIPAASSQVNSLNIRDRRPWAKGASNFGLTPNGGSAVFGPTVYTSIYSGLQFRLECTGKPLIFTFEPSLLQDSANANATLTLSPSVDGTAILTDTNHGAWIVGAQASNNFVNGVMKTNYVPMPGSHLLNLQAFVAGNAWNIGPLSAFRAVEDLVGANSNGAT